MDVIGSIWHCGAQLPIRNPPGERVVVEEQDASELASGVEVGPVDSGPSVGGVEDEGLKRRVERS